MKLTPPALACCRKETGDLCFLQMSGEEYFNIGT